ncbi:hypothetical protein N825_30985 [Skermanella stibiiresistens SB22]|uniref:Uncharacterized protein n=1 Tax=Skermanella stibiiresistens SB22 TaxID=1385369 RepID=W9HBI8_9PROT|nr:hypothetical protein [Skermanella stibiiresistens]EWY41238.1 hypothetical protein N825_30985 [Skermanella stibiiresistens SB22]
MPNVAVIAENAEEFRKSIERMNGTVYSRDAVSFNHGIRTATELEDLVCQEPFVPTNLDGIAALLRESNDE